jgi:DNA-binding NtrC family response regulator
MKDMSVENRRIVKIMITDFPTTENHLNAQSNGADAYMEKPMKPEEFISVIAQEIGKKGSRKSKRDKHHFCMKSRCHQFLLGRGNG